MNIDDKFFLALTLCKRSLLAEFYQHFGRDMTEEFVKLFGGTYLRVPTMLEVERHIKDITIYQHLAARPQDYKAIMQLYGVNQDKVDTIMKKVTAEATVQQTPPPGFKRRPRLAELPTGITRKPR